MNTSVISSKYQIVIPREIRERFNLQPGQKVMFIPYQGGMRLVVVSSIEDACGMLAGMGVSDFREEEDEERG